MWLQVQLCVASLLIICITHWVYKWRNPKCNGVLPPGSMGIPLIGETIQLIIPSHSLDVLPFIKKRLQKYGPLFRTSVAGRPVVVSADPEFNHFLFQQEGRLVEGWYLDLFAKIFKEEERKPDGATIHKYVRNLVLQHFGVQRLKTKLLPQLEEMADNTLRAWSSRESIEVKYETSVMTIEFGAKLLFSDDSKKLPLNLADKYIGFSQGLMSFPLNIPGTTYHKCMKSHKEASNIMLNVFKKRLASPEPRRDDVLDQLIQDMKVEKFLTEDLIVHLLFAILFVSIDSLSSMIPLAFKLLAENPLVLEELKAEHEAILKRREYLDSSITWEEYTEMTFTRQVINEVLRIGSVAPGLMRRARKDIQVNGYTIPAGWAIIAATSAVQLDPNCFEDPLAFNPWRWKDLQPNVVTKLFSPFGSGIKQCAGAEYSKMLMAVFFHVLVTKYKWTKIEGGDIVRNPILKFRNGLRIQIRKNQCDK